MKKGQSLLIQFVLFFFIGFTLFVTIGSFFKMQSESFRSDATDYNIKLANSYLSSFAITMIDSCKQCDYATIKIKLENTTTGYFFKEDLNSFGLNVSVPFTEKSFLNTVHNFNYSTAFAGNTSSAKTISLTFNRSQNVLYIGEFGIIQSPETTTTSLPASSTTTTTISAWQFRKSVTISNSLSTLSDYQVLVTTDTTSLVLAGKMRSDCGDVRFRDSDGTTDLNYWIESDCNSVSTKIWVNVSSIPFGSKTIYMYYGNPSATSTSNATATMEWYDNFDTNRLSEYTTVGSSTFSVSGGNLVHNNPCNTEGALIYPTSLNIQNFTMRTRLLSDFQNRGAGALYRFQNTNNFYGYALRGGGSDGLWKRVSGSNTQLISPGSGSTWENITLNVVGMSHNLTVSGAITYSGSINDASINQAGRIGLGAGWGDPPWNNWCENNWFDYLIVSKLASPEPITTVGLEENL